MSSLKLIILGAVVLILVAVFSLSGKSNTPTGTVEQFDATSDLQQLDNTDVNAMDQDLNQIDSDNSSI